MNGRCSCDGLHRAEQGKLIHVVANDPFIHAVEKQPTSRRSPATTGGMSTGVAGAAPLALADVLSSAPASVFTSASSPGRVMAMEMEEEESLSVGLDVHPSSSHRSPGVVCYSRSPRTPSSPALGSPALVPATPPPSGLDPASTVSPTAGSKARAGASPMVAARQSARLSQSWTLLDGRVPTIPEKAAMRAAARDLSPGNSPVPNGPSCSGSRFAVLGSVPLGHLADVASDCDIVFRGEKGPRLE